MEDYWDCGIVGLNECGVPTAAADVEKGGPDLLGTLAFSIRRRLSFDDLLVHFASDDYEYARVLRTYRMHTEFRTPYRSTKHGLIGQGHQ